jgi:hypothetical protein
MRAPMRVLHPPAAAAWAARAAAALVGATAATWAAPTAATLVGPAAAALAAPTATALAGAPWIWPAQEAGSGGVVLVGGGALVARGGAQLPSSCLLGARWTWGSLTHQVRASGAGVGWRAECPQDLLALSSGALALAVALAVALALAGLVWGGGGRGGGGLRPAGIGCCCSLFTPSSQDARPMGPQLLVLFDLKSLLLQVRGMLMTARRTWTASSRMALSTPLTPVRGSSRWGRGGGGKGLGVGAVS